MYCRICKKFFKVNRSLKELFINKKLYLCSDCINRYKLDPKHIVIPLDKYNINVFVLYANMNLKYVSIYAKEYSEIIKKLIKNGHHVVLLDYFDESYINTYEQIVKILEGNVTFVSFLLKTL